MKYLQILIAVVLIITFSSCKKNYIYTQADLIGTWTETQPYIFNNGHYILQFNSNDTVIEFAPDSSVTQYKLMGNNTIQLNNFIPYGPGVTGNAVFTMTGNANNMTIINFVNTYNGPGGTSLWLNLTLRKN